MLGWLDGAGAKALPTVGLLAGRNTWLSRPLSGTALALLAGGTILLILAGGAALLLGISFARLGEGDLSSSGAGFCAGGILGRRWPDRSDGGGLADGGRGAEGAGDCA